MISRTSNSGLQMKYVFLIATAAMTLGILGCDGDDNGSGPITIEGLAAVNGLYYKGEMGSSALTPELIFGVKDNDGNWLPGYQIQLHLIEGDGELSARSVTTDSTGLAAVTFTFDGDLGHAEILATARDEKDSVTVYLRANTLIPGNSGQGQYVLLDDVYADVLALNGTPTSLDPFGAVVVANYESEFGLVVLHYDTNEDGAIEADSPVFGVLVVDSVYPQSTGSSVWSKRYEGMTQDSIQIGSSYHADIVPVYGEADTIWLDDDPQLPALVVEYDSLFLNFWCFPDDTTAFQIDIFEEFDESLYESPYSGGPPEPRRFFYPGREHQR